MDRSLRLGLAVLGGVVVVTAVALGVWAVGNGEPAAEPTLQFEEVSDDHGFDYTANREQQLGSTRAGVYVSDVNNDGYPGFLAIGGDEPTLYLNDEGTIGESDALPPIEGPIKSAVFFDREGDGWDDLLLFRIAASPIFLENREGSFHRRGVGLNDTEFRIPIAATVADYDRDGCLDVFVVENGDWSSGSPKKETRGVTGPDKPRNPKTAEIENDNGNQNRLLEGDCASGTFSDVTASTLPNATRWSLAASFVDFNDDGYPDIHVANDYNFDYLYVNQLGQSFESIQITGTNRNGMSSETADVNQDGAMDVFVSNIHFPNGIGKEYAERFLKGINDRGNNLLINEDGRLKERAYEYDVRYGGWGWASAVVDFQNDGRSDLVHATKFLQTNVSTYHKTEPSIWTRSNATFVRRNASALGFETSNGRGLAHFDFDRDGDQDLLIGTIDGSYKLYENQVDAGNWLQIAVRSADGAHATGTRLEVTTSTETYHLVSNAKADLLSQDTRTHHVGLADADTVSVRIEFADGSTDEITDVQANQRLTVFANGTVVAADGDELAG